MNWLTITWSLAVSACLTLAVAHLIVWVKNPSKLNRRDLLFWCLGASLLSAVCLLVFYPKHIPRSPLLIALPFLAPSSVMAWELLWDAVRTERLSGKRHLIRAKKRHSRRAGRDATRLRNELAHLSRVNMLGELSGSLAHELNQPLTAILSNAQAAQRYLDQEQPDIAEVREILKDIIEADNRAGETIYRMRTLFRKGKVQNTAIDLNATVREVLKFLNSDLINNLVTAQTDLEPGLPPINGDRVQLQQVLINLIANGCDAMRAVDVADRALLLRTTHGPDNIVEVMVSDRGCGIPPKRLNGVFEPFVTTKSQGMGLGLAVCQTIVGAHGGRIWATNNADRGTTFHITLPGASVPSS